MTQAAAPVAAPADRTIKPGTALERAFAVDRAQVDVESRTVEL